MMMMIMSKKNQSYQFLWTIFSRDHESSPIKIDHQNDQQKKRDLIPDYKETSLEMTDEFFAAVVVK